MNLNPNKKRRWYHNVADAYRITARSYPWIGWLLGGYVVVFVALGLLVAFLTDGSWILWIISGIMTALLAGLITLTQLAQRALYRQIDGIAGSSYAALQQIKRGWIIPDQPIAANREQDLVWRAIGRPGVVLIAEGPVSRVQSLVQAERKKITRVMHNVPVTVIFVGNGDGQVPLHKLQRKMNRLKKVLTNQEVPSVDARLRALSKASASIPKGIDPAKARMSRRALRGR